MELEEYLQLPEELQWDYLHEDGTELAHRFANRKEFLLFSLEAFYVEIELGRNGFGSTLKAFGMGPEIDGYLKDAVLPSEPD